MLKTKTLRGRLARFYGALLALALCAFTGVVWIIIEVQESSEPPEVALLEGPDYTVRRMLIALGLALPAAVGVAALGAWVIARRALGPVDDVVAFAASIRAEQLGARLEIRADAVEEMRSLGRSLNTMLERLEESVEGMRRFTADAAHELRTPLARLQGNLELALRQPRTPEELRSTVEGAQEELQRLSRLVESLLTLARSDAGVLAAQPVELDLDKLVRDTAEPYRAVLAAQEIALELETEGARVKTDPMWVGRVLANLLDNACKLTPPGGRVQIKQRATAIEVRDSGPGVSAADRERIFERFYRGTGEGFGLGLALGREIARALGGELALLPSESGAAFVFTLSRE